MRTSPKGVDLIKRFEGFRACPYLCPAGVATIGYGSTYYPNKKAVTMSDKPITEHEASIMLDLTLIGFEAGVIRLADPVLIQNQFDALVCFAYNLGLGNLKKSLLLGLVNRQKFESASDEFLKWNKAGGKVLDGLTKRRQAERELFMTR